MLRDKDYIFGRINLVVDLLLTALALLATHALRNLVLGPYVFPEIFRFPSNLADYWWLLLILPVVSVSLLAYYGHYGSERVRSTGSVVVTILMATIGASLVAMVLSFVLTPRGNSAGWSSILTGEFVSRGVLILFVPIATTFLTMKTLVLRAILVNLRKRGLNARSLLLVGDLKLAEEFLSYVDQHPYWGFKVSGIITNDPGKEESQGSSIDVVGGYDDLFDYLEKHVVDDVVFVPGDDGMNTLAPMLRGCEEMGIRTRLPMQAVRQRIARPVLETFDDLPVITFNPVHEVGAALLLKYVFDRIAALITLVVLSPLILGIYFWIKATSENWSDPAFYSQVRCGLNGREFKLWKFRSMKVDADQMRGELESFNEMTGPVFKMKNDPRITPVGHWLRKTSLDELPQFWNVLRGEMSIVGPRPPLPSEVVKYDRWQRRRLSMKPGITCIWQVSGRNRLSFEEWMEMDLEYIDKWSLALDFRILCKTIYVVATGYGAM